MACPDFSLLKASEDSEIYFPELKRALSDTGTDAEAAAEAEPGHVTTTESAPPVKEPTSDNPRTKRRRISSEVPVLHGENVAVDTITLIERQIDIDFSAAKLITDKIHQFIRDDCPQSNGVRLSVEVVVSDSAVPKLEILSKETNTRIAEIRFLSGDYITVFFELEWVGKIAISKRSPVGHSKRVDEFNYSTTLRIRNGVGESATLVQLEVVVTMAQSNRWTQRSLALTEHWYPLIAYTFPQGKPQVWNPTVVTTRDFYESVTIPPTVDHVPPSIQSPNLDCELLPFQRRAVRWMLRKEGYDVQDRSNSLTRYQPDPDEFTPPLFFKGIDRRGRTCWISHILGVVSTDIRALIDAHCKYRGGILAEEMGLGKTVELIALILLNRRQPSSSPSLYDAYTDKTITPSSATLIITPPSILRQWQDELYLHAPSLKVFHYQGVIKHKVDIEVHDLIQYDIVLTTYDVLSAEVYFTQSKDRTLRETKRYIPKSSPLVQISWWRVCLDEAQMVESGVSNAAIVARVIPRVNAWAVTGTPVRKDIRDLLGLLVFLRYEPFSSNSRAWKYLTLYNKLSFNSLFGSLTLRHVKESVRNELHLPPQNRVVVTVPLSHIEEQNYSFLFDTMCNECGVSLDKLIEPRMQVDGITLERLKRWLVRLRQSCTHPEVGSGNRRALGGGNGPLRSVSEVLDIMIEQHEAQLRTNERMLLSLKLRRGQMFEYYGKVQQAMEVYRDVLEQTRRVIAECRQNIRKEQRECSVSENTLQEQTSIGGGGDRRGEVNDEDASNGYNKAAGDNEKSKLGPLKSRLRAFLEVEHAALFFIGSVFYQMKTVEEEDVSTGGREKIEEYDKLETENYEAAKVVRRELLAETESKAQRFIRILKEKADYQKFTEIPELTVDHVTGGIEIRTMLDELNLLKNALNNQANILDEWRETVVQHLQHPLIDEAENASGAEFEESVNFQEKGIAYLEAIKAMVHDREVALSGRQNNLIAEDLKRALGRKETHTALLHQLVAYRNQLMPQTVARPMRELVSALRALVNALREEEQGGNKRAGLEKKLADDEFKRIQEAFQNQLKANAELEKEIDLYRDTINSRVDFYRQFQVISDSVAPYNPEVEHDDSSFSEVIIQKMVKREGVVESEIAIGRAKGKYLDHLKATSTGEARHCIICQSDFEIGSLTVCGHQYCKECLLVWFRSHRNCPMCKKVLKPEDIHPITYKPEDVSIQEEKSTNTVEADKIVLSLYHQIGTSTLKEIKLIDLPISFGSKIDMICRHLIWIRRNDLFAKCVIFSQWSDVLAVLERAFAENDIGFSNSAKNGVNRFKNDPKVQCFLLHAKSQSAGLTLVNATHVFICEPLLNPGIELQAISRVHRIGQTKPTTVWLYAVSHTIEESVLRVATKRRLALMGSEGTQDQDESTSSGDSTPVDLQISESKLDMANSLELRLNQRSLVEKTPGGGEIVRDEDLWECLVGCAKERLESSKVEKEVKRYLFASAAESRIRGEQMENQQVDEEDYRHRGNNIISATVDLPFSHLKEGQPGPSNHAGL